MNDKTRIFLLLVMFGILLIVTQCQAQKLAITVNIETEKPETSVKPGVLVKIAAPELKLPQDQYKYDWRLNNPPKEYKFAEWIFEDGKYIVFASAIPGKYEFDLVVVTAVEKVITVERIQHSVIVLGTIVPDKPNTGDTSPDTPEGPSAPPEGPSFGLTTLTTLLANKVNDETTAALLASAYESVAGRIKSGSIKTSKQAQTAIVKANRSVLANGETKEAWESFTRGLNAEFGKLAKAGKLDSVTNLQVIFLEVAAGLRGAK